MARAATGTVEYRNGRWWARVAAPNGKRPRVPLAITDPEAREAAEAEARELAALAARAPRQGSAGESVEDWYERWCLAREARGTSARAPRSHLECHILPVLRGRPIAGVTPRDLERLVRRLDDAVAAGELRWKSAINIWGTVTKAFDDAHRGKISELRCREDNPCKSVRGPSRGVDTAKVHLYPGEFLALVSSSVPLRRRQAYAIGVYLYLRPAELEALAWEDIDLARGVVQIQRSIDRETGEATSPKAGVSRHPQDIEAPLLPLLEAMHYDGASGPVVGRLGDDSLLADQLRRDLLDAGVTRHELHHASIDPPREWMRMHDLRTTGITWMAVRGGDPLTIMARAGHHDMETTLGYVSQAALVRRGYGQVFPELPAELVESSRQSSPKSSIRLDSRGPVAETHGNRRDVGVRAAAKKPRLSLILAREATREHAPKFADPRPGDDSRDDWSPARIDLVQRILEAGKRAASRRDSAALHRLLDAARDAAPAVPTQPGQAKRRPGG